MRAFIYVGGAVNADMITEHPKGDDMVICADSGYENAKKLGERADIFVGDMDSYTGELDEKVQVVRLKPEKDVTDTQAAFELAVEKGADVAAFAELPVRERIGRAKSVSEENYKSVYADILAQADEQIAALLA